MKTLTEKVKESQKAHSDRVYKKRFSAGWKSFPRTMIGDFIDYYPLKKAISLLPFSIKGKTVLNICCGDGLEAKYLVGLGAKVTVSDISKEAVRAAQRRCSEVKGVVADAENLPLKGKSFDLVIVRAGLHHLPDPHKGISEMNRVCKKGFVFIEAQKNFITMILINLRLAEEYEESGNYVYRFTRKEIHNLMKEFKIKDYKIEAVWCRYVEFLHKKIYPVFDNKIWLVIFKFLFFGFNTLFGRWGNTLIVAGWKD